MLFGYNLWHIPLQYREGRNPDIAEIDLKTIVELYHLQPIHHAGLLQQPHNSSAAFSAPFVFGAGSSSSFPNAENSVFTFPRPDFASNPFAVASSSIVSANPTQYYDLNTRNLKFGRAYGFRNIQTILNKMKKSMCDLDLIEVMACPSGCNNGGGQLKTLSSIFPISMKANSTMSTPARPETPLESKERVSSVEKLYHLNLTRQEPDQSPLVRYLFDRDRLVKPLSGASLATLHTRYHAVPSLEIIAPLTAKW